MGIYDNLNVDIFYFVHNIRDTNWMLNDKIHYYDLIFFLDGQAEYMVNDTAYNVSKGDVMLIKPNSIRYAKTTRMHIACIDFFTNGIDINLPTLFHLDNLCPYVDLLNQFNNEWLKQNSEYKLKCKGIFYTILGKLTEDQCAFYNNPVIENIKQYITDNYNKNIGINEIAAHANLNPVYCGALFKKEEKCTISQYLNRIRINAAASLLKNSHLSVGDVAFEVGFNDIYYFSKTFKKITGVSPSSLKNKSLN